MPAVIDEVKCNGCGQCDLLCPIDVIHMEKGVAKMRYVDECWHCGTCRLVCPKNAVSFEFPPSMLNI